LWANGQLLRGVNGMAGEFGHVPLPVETNTLEVPACGCGGRGCWETFASNRAALREYLGPGGDLAGFSFLDLMRRAEDGDARAGQVLENMARYVGRGMRILIAGLAPERIVVVGDLTRGWHRFGPLIEEEVRAQTLPGGVVPRVSPAYEDGMARLRGTVALVLQRDFGHLSDAA
jgi:predicted NBD/HSP70 family sugar kinase